MVASLQQRLALAVLVGVLLVPLLASNLRGLTHLLTCSEGVTQRFAIAGGEEGGASVLTSSTALTNAAVEADAARMDGTAAGSDIGREPDGEGGAAASGGELLCGALRVEVAAREAVAGTVLVTVALTNESDLPWSGTLGLRADGDAVDAASLRAPVGRIAPGQRSETQLELRVPPGQTELDGTLLLGP